MIINVPLAAFIPLRSASPYPFVFTLMSLTSFLVANTLELSVLPLSAVIISYKPLVAFPPIWQSFITASIVFLR